MKKMRGGGNTVYINIQDTLNPLSNTTGFVYYNKANLYQEYAYNTLMTSTKPEMKFFIKVDEAEFEFTMKKTNNKSICQLIKKNGILGNEFSKDENDFREIPEGYKHSDFMTVAKKS